MPNRNGARMATLLRNKIIDCLQGDQNISFKTNGAFKSESLIRSNRLITVSRATLSADQAGLMDCIFTVKILGSIVKGAQSPELMRTIDQAMHRSDFSCQKMTVLSRRLVGSSDYQKPVRNALGLLCFGSMDYRFVVGEPLDANAWLSDQSMRQYSDAVGAV